MSYEAGTWNAECERCGFKYKARQLRPEWNGLRTCHGPGTNGCWEERHPQDFVRSRPDKQSVPWSNAPEFNVLASEVSRDDL